MDGDRIDDDDAEGGDEQDGTDEFAAQEGEGRSHRRRPSH